jgi:hypothetical protein
VWRTAAPTTRSMKDQRCAGSSPKENQMLALNTLSPTVTALFLIVAFAGFVVAAVFSWPWRSCIRSIGYKFQVIIHTFNGSIKIANHC